MTQQEYNSAYKAAKYYERKRAGLCVMCGKEDAFTMVGRSRCSECAERNNQNKRKNYNREWHRARYDDRKANGLCVDCGKPALEGHVRCAYHCEQRSKSTKAWLKRAQEEAGVNDPRGGNGYCYRCNKEKQLPGMKVCQKCYSGLEDLRARKKPGNVSNHPWSRDNDYIFGRRPK